MWIISIEIKKCHILIISIQIIQIKKCHKCFIDILKKCYVFKKMDLCH